MADQRERELQQVVAEVRAARPVQPLGLWWLGPIGTAVALLLLVTRGIVPFGLALGVTLGVLALLRAVLPTRMVGGLAVRGRWLDVAVLVVLGAAVVALSLLMRESAGTWPGPSTPPGG